ncbi:hypothetical protein [Maridesulfovibrio bastinii]|uniref:hypothetical protein n=1 Tax=Maridesulfovibrio bastinii TaxID=47157 RepID=UPI0003F6262D|nr:hypothetical protein [Maridesulfovibrio bastinii]
MLKRHLIIAIVFMFLLGLSGCGSSGGSSSSGSVSGGTGGHPVANGTIDALKSIDLDPEIDANWIKNVGTTGTDGTYTFSKSQLSGATFPVMLRVKKGTGYIPNDGNVDQIFQSDLFAVIKEDFSSNITVNFTLFSSLETKLLKSKVDSGKANDDAAKEAKDQTLNLMSSLGLDTSKFNDPQKVTVSDPGVILSQSTLWKGDGLDLDMDKSGAESSKVSDILDKLATKIQDGGSSYDALKELGALREALNSDPTKEANALQNYITGTVADSPDYKDILKIAYNGIVEDADTAIDDAKDEIKAEDNAADTIGLFKINSITPYNAYSKTDGSSQYMVQSNMDTSVTISFEATAADGSGLEAASLFVDSSGGAVDKIPSSTDINKKSFSFKIEYTHDVLEPGYNENIEITLTSKSGSTATLYVPMSVYSEVDNLPYSLSISAKHDGKDKRLIDLNSEAIAESYMIEADVESTGSSIDSDYFVNFYAPSGLKFKLGEDKQSNYMRPIESGRAELDTVQFVNATTLKNGKRGPVRAVVYKYNDSTKTYEAYAPAVEAQTLKDFYSTNEGENTLEKMVLEIQPLDKDTSTNYKGFITTDVNDTELDLHNDYQLRLTFVTWGGDGSIDDIHGETFDKTTAGVDGKHFWLVTSSLLGGFHKDTPTVTYDGNVDLGNLVAVSSDEYGNGVAEFTADSSTFDKLDDANALKYMFKTGKTSNIDEINVEMYESGSTSTTNSSSPVIIRYVGTNS